jgi:hypothetical protein
VGVLEAQQEGFGVLVFDNGDGGFAEAVKAAFSRQAPRIPLTVVRVGEKPEGGLKTGAVILPGSLAVNPPEQLRAWMGTFHGSRLIVPDEAQGVYWMNDLGGTVAAARALAEGQELRPGTASSGPPIWVYVAYVFAALFALQLLFGLLMAGISLVTGF